MAVEPKIAKLRPNPNQTPPKELTSQMRKTKITNKPSSADKCQYGMLGLSTNIDSAKAACIYEVLTNQQVLLVGASLL